MIPGAQDPHAWTVKQLLAYSAGMLPEAELLRVEAHLVACPECRVLLATLKPAAGSDPGHLPASLIATWGRTAPALGGLERELVEAHLEWCEPCRAALRFAGFEPVVDAEPAPARSGARVPAAPSRLRLRRTWGWALAFSGVAAAAAVVLITIGPGTRLREPAEWLRGLMGLPATHATGVTFDLAVDSLAAGAIVLPQPGFRGTPSRPLDVGVVTNVSGVVLVMPPALRPPSPEDGERRLTLTLLRDGRELAGRSVSFFQLGDAIRIRPQGRLEPGDYDLRFALSPAVATEPPLTWFYRLRVR